VEKSSEQNGHQVRSERSTRLIIRAAGDLVVEGGYQTMTLATVGERAGYSRSLATARFGSKAKLLEALVDEIEQHWDIETALPTHDGQSGLETLRTFIVNIRDAYKRDPWSLAVMYALMFEALRPVPDLRGRITDMHRDLHSRIASIVSAGIEDGSIDPKVEPEQQASMIIAQMRGVGYLWQLDPEGVDPESVLTLFLEQCMENLSRGRSRRTKSTTSANRPVKTGRRGGRSAKSEV
jgi:AcrR family transcriptional regulator